MANAIIWLCPPTTQSKKVSTRKIQVGRRTVYHIEQEFVEKDLKTKKYQFGKKLYLCGLNFKIE